MTISVHFNNQPNDTDYRYLELTKELAELIQSNNPNQTLVFRGPIPLTPTTQDRNVTLHSKDATYLVREVQTSNTMIAVTPLEYNENDWPVEFFSGDYLELTQVPPPQLRESVRQLLVGTEFSESSTEVSCFKQITFSQLVGQLQVSEVELQAELNAIFAIEIAGYIRLLELNYVQDILTLLLTTAGVFDLGINQLPVASLIEALSVDVKEHILTTVLSHFSSYYDGEMATLCALKISSFYAHVILSPLGIGGSMSLAQFEELWLTIVPEPFTCDLEQIKSFTLVTRSESALHFQDTIHYVPSNELPGTPPQRLRLLFSIRERWPRDEIIHLVRDLTLDGSDKSCDQLLVRHARMIKSEAQVFFGPRKDMNTLK